MLQVRLMGKQEEINEAVKQAVTPELFRKEYERVFDDNERWNEIKTNMH